MSGWQPIKTAPKDGSLILLADIDLYHRPQVFAARWDEAGDIKYPWAFLDLDSVRAPMLNRMMAGMGPTHWMPDSIPARNTIGVFPPMALKWNPLGLIHRIRGWLGFH